MGAGLSVRMKVDISGLASNPATSVIVATLPRRCHGSLFNKLQMRANRPGHSSGLSSGSESTARNVCINSFHSRSIYSLDHGQYGRVKWCGSFKLLERIRGFFIFEVCWAVGHQRLRYPKSRTPINHCFCCCICSQVVTSVEPIGRSDHLESIERASLP